MRAILTYHSLDGSGSRISVHPTAFARHMKWLASAGVRVTTVPELLTQPAEADAVALTFDDAFVNFATVAAPLLRKYGLPATLFVVTDAVGRDNLWGGRKHPGVPLLPLLDWPALRALAGSGITIGAHTQSHVDLTTVAPDIVAREVRGSAQRLEAEIGRRPRVFAYPYGRVTPETAEIVGLTFQWACTTEFRPLGLNEDPQALPRLDMYYFQAPDRLESWGTSRFEWYLRLRRGMRRVRGRLAASVVSR